MKWVRVGTLFVVAVLLSACATMQTSCFSSDCQQLGANNSSLKVWWSPELRNDSSEYSLVHLND
uniref:HrpT n=1 Tax=Pseudomonas viridiflava TaxID=33069 RepID=B3IXJ8_PSEVI|nr:HrpT [Pseudomonas viridiflava]